MYFWVDGGKIIVYIICYLAVFSRVIKNDTSAAKRVMEKIVYTLCILSDFHLNLYIEDRATFLHRDHGSLAKMSWNDPEHRYYTDPRHA